jgi:hypothetical protein
MTGQHPLSSDLHCHAAAGAVTSLLRVIPCLSRCVCNRNLTLWIALLLRVCPAGTMASGRLALLVTSRRCLWSRRHTVKRRPGRQASR